MITMKHFRIVMAVYFLYIGIISGIAALCAGTEYETVGTIIVAILVFVPMGVAFDYLSTSHAVRSSIKRALDN